MYSSKYPSPKGSALITPVRGSIVNATRCGLRVTGFGFRITNSVLFFSYIKYY